tara:strand:- start:1772 stop:2308 length:537 start_codon:yes stop_codon:yes gene_type:complete
MAKNPVFSADKVSGDLEFKLNRDYNALIKKVIKRLSTKKRSPVYTGFFASSWKAQSVPVKPTDKVEKYQPWAAIKKQIDVGSTRSARRALSKSLSKVEPRFEIRRNFDIKRSVYIGNKAQYSLYALESGKVQLFMQGEIGQLIKDTMGDKGRTFISGDIGIGSFGKTSGGEYIRYTEF